MFNKQWYNAWMYFPGIFLACKPEACRTTCKIKKHKVEVNNNLRNKKNDNFYSEDSIRKGNKQHTTSN